MYDIDMAKTLSILQKVQSLKARYHQNAIHKESLIQLIAQSEVSEHVYNSNAIENSTLTLDETQKILLEIDLERYINQRELFEAKNLARVVGYINSVATQKEMDLEMILFLHKMLLTHINDDIAGRFRKGDEWVRVGSYIAPDPKYVVDRLLKLLVDYHAKSDWHIVKKMAFFHLTFEHIHPFVDGNGRIGRVLNNYFFNTRRFWYLSIFSLSIDSCIMMHFDSFRMTTKQVLWRRSLEKH